MLTRLIPRQFDNTPGSRVAWWILGAVLLLKLPMGVNAMLFTRLVARVADGLPLDRYGAAGERAVLAFFSLWGLGQLLMSLLGVVAMVRYRSMIPLIYLMLLLEQVGRRAMFWLHPLRDPASPPASTPLPALIINWGLLLLLAIGFLLSVMAARRGDRQAMD